MNRYLFMPLVIYIPVGIYLFFVFRRFFCLLGLKKKSIATTLLSIFLVLASVFWGWRLFGFGGVVVLHFAVISFFMDLLNFIFKQLLPMGSKKVWDTLYRSSLTSLLVMAIIFGYGYWNIHHVIPAGYTIETEKNLPGDVKIAQISDLHAGNVFSFQQLEQCLKQIQEEQPDLFVLTGDIFDESTTREEMEKTIEMLSQIQTTYGTYYVFGNHDYNYYSLSPFYTVNELRKALTDAGIHVLEDETVQVTDFLTVVGRKDRSVSRKSLQELVAAVNPNTFILVLDHQPKGLSENQNTGADLQLSGHTHAGQIWPTGQLGTLTGAVELNYGLKSMDHYQVLVSSGIAGWGYPIRTGGHSEYVIVTVKSNR